MTFAAKVCFFALLAVILSCIITPVNPAFKHYFSAGAAVILFLSFLTIISPLLERFTLLFGSAAPKEILSVAFKGLGIAFLVSVCASFCRDLGEEGVAGKLELCGKGAMLYLALPLLEEIMSMIETILP